MKTKILIGLGAGLLLVVILVHAAPSVARVPVRIPSALFRWGTILQSDEAFYRVGETAEVTCGVYNLTDQDLYMENDGGSCPNQPVIVNDQGQVVWQAGAVFGGYYLPPECAPPRHPFPVLIRKNGGRWTSGGSIPLIYQNGHGVGPQGSPLAPGFYEIRFVLRATGPLRDGQVNGLMPSATLPFQIEP